MPTFSRTTLLAAAGVAALALVTACDAGGGSAPYGAGSTHAAAATTSTVAPQLVAASSPALGPIVTDGAGHTLYRFDKDTAKPSSVSACTGGCAATWPPAPAGDHVQVQGVDSALVGSVTRPDGTKQLTLNGWPLYRYALDAKPGDAKGQGVGGTWFASTPEGRKAATATAASPAATSAGY